MVISSELRRQRLKSQQCFAKRTTRLRPRMIGVGHPSRKAAVWRVGGALNARRLSLESTLRLPARLGKPRVEACRYQTVKQPLHTVVHFFWENEGGDAEA